MEQLTDPVILSRLQFALTAMFHILWPVLTIGLALFLVVLEALWLRTGEVDYYRLARFWSKLLLLNFAVGVVSGLPLEFEFGTNWSPFSILSGEFFGNVLGFEGAMAFMLEAGFVGIMAMGWARVSRGMHFFATCMVALGATLSAFWILVANSWMQAPGGGHFEAGRFIVDDYLQAIFSPGALTSAAHMWMACLETSLFVIAGLSAWYILHARHTVLFMKSFRLAVLAAMLVAPLQIWLGDAIGQSVFQQQPAKGAALEGHWETNRPGTGADWALLAWPDRAQQANDWSLTIPNGLSLLATHSLKGQVRGLREFPERDQPPALPLLFYAFRLMVAIGFWFLLLTIMTLTAWRRGRLTVSSAPQIRWLLTAWVFSMPLGYLAVECGWLVREIGRQPWVVYGVLRTDQAASTLPAATVATTLVMYAAIYAILTAVFIIFARRILDRGPDSEGSPGMIAISAGIPHSRS
jgi:cytochrome d ubiquinol oxidase subunit I